MKTNGIITNIYFAVARYSEKNGTELVGQFESVDEAKEESGVLGGKAVKVRQTTEWKLPDRTPEPPYLEECAEFNEIIEKWVGGGDDPEMIMCYAVDRQDLTAVLELFKSGDFEAATVKIRRLDTIVRELIPESVWRIIYGNED